MYPQKRHCNAAAADAEPAAIATERHESAWTCNVAASNTTI
jgi:hypothetical protein